ncbi:glycosyltransferase family 4 protein [Ancylobacter radicis]|uniref:Glycosyltransferase family 4 protein n=1 Tax=Ancylobacter radicis TaxID=2836179 RepID=A0ABS5RCE0_9HYPH|nr:glycosyltransferase family 4 protein [Ancylobacter radicis]
MSAFAFAIPGDLSLATGGYAYDRRILAECRRAGGAAVHVALPAGFPFPSLADLADSEQLLRALPDGQAVLIDGLALGAMPAALLRGLGRPVAALIHHPLALEAGLASGERARLEASEREVLAQVDAVIATSPATARLLERDYAVRPELLRVAVPGTDPAPRAIGTGTPPRLLAVGAVIPRKAYGVLVEALAGLAGRDWSCRIVGATDRDPGETRALRDLIARHGLGERIVLTGAIGSDALDAEFAAADCLVSASLFEGYGMGLTEAIARGLPVVATRGGAIPETLPAQAALLVEPGDASALADAITRLIEDPALRHRMAGAAWQAAQGLPRWPESAAIIMKAMQEMTR